MASVEIIWEQILSRDPLQVRAAFFALDMETRRQVAAHLRVMTSEEGWHPEQVISAQKALEAIDEKEVNGAVDFPKGCSAIDKLNQRLNKKDEEQK